MKISISNIAWEAGQDADVYSLMEQMGFQGLEVAPTRIFPKLPYSCLQEARNWRKKLPFEVPSMQSIWFGRKERLFGTSDERLFLQSYTHEAILFASAIGCRNLVFGCPRNRQLFPQDDESLAVPFFLNLSKMAYEQGCKIGMEANPPVYHTNYINDTPSALRLVEAVAHPAFGLNLDVGAMICNRESVEMLRNKVASISHVHISEPMLCPIQARPLHEELAALLKEEGYQGYVSLEMRKVDDFSLLVRSMEYVSKVFLCS